MIVACNTFESDLMGTNEEKWAWLSLSRPNVCSKVSLKYALGLSQLVNAGPNVFNWDVADKTKERKAKKYFVGNWRTRKNFFFVFIQITLSTSERDSWCRCCCCRRNFQKFPTFSERIFPTRYENSFIWYLIKHCFTKLHKTKQAGVLPKNKLNQHYISEFKKHPAHNGREVLQVAWPTC